MIESALAARATLLAACFSSLPAAVAKYGTLITLDSSLTVFFAFFGFDTLADSISSLASLRTAFFAFKLARPFPPLNLTSSPSIEP
ncbi:hypothetical protein BKA61DRAFT_619098 [Leptodontidium sp. MPI-SDFR-AT-0119]|nr:hypothetical protein BKA61DRAFT_619098 [Leptodontidium sp. MPI-SDFR-AT-0119]